MARIALFGTSADPPTLGHASILQWLATQFDTVAVWAVDNPFKTDQTCLEHRQQMLGLLIADIQDHHPNVCFYPALSSPRTLISVNAAHEEWPQASLHVIVGSDVLESLPSWYEAETLLNRADFLVIPRPGFPVEMETLQSLQAMGGHMTVAPFVGPDISSTDLRQTGQVERTLPAIAAYMEAHHLYQHQQSGSCG